MNDDRIKGQLDDRTLQTRKMLTKLVMAMLMTVVRTYVMAMMASVMMIMTLG